MDNEIVLETKLVGDIKGEFFVPSYQRGYRWGADEVTRMLDDIYANGMKKNKGKYCLQPVVVRKKGKAYELVDGQQRLTTLYLIYRYIRNANKFSEERLRRIFRAVDDVLAKIENGEESYEELEIQFNVE